MLKLPIGIEDFEEIRTEGFYYVDKTGLITELLNNWSKVNLFFLIIQGESFGFKSFRGFVFVGQFCYRFAKTSICRFSSPTIS